VVVHSKLTPTMIRRRLGSFVRRRRRPPARVVEVVRLLCRKYISEKQKPFDIGGDDEREGGSRPNTYFSDLVSDT